MATTSHKEQWIRWLVEERHISLAVARTAKLAFDATRLIIPVFDKDGTLVATKYRRAPWITEGPKYTYEAGGKAALYGVETIKDAKQIILTEGECDSLALRTIGYTAISTTGGASTFPDEWIDVLAGKEVVILYDADKAGVEGAIKVMRKLPNARIAWIPIVYGKDVTEVIHGGGTDELHRAIFEAKVYPRGWKELLDVLLKEKEYAMSIPTMSPFMFDIGIAYVAQRIHEEKSAEKYTHKREKNATDIENARKHPIRNLIPVNQKSLSKCLWHNDTHPSMRVYQDNHVFCFSCSRHDDAIGVYRALHNCSFKEAVDALK